MPNDPDIPPPPWQRAPDRQSRRRREPISRDAIVAAAIGLLDREGLAALSMRRLAEELGTGAASLYWHVGSKDGLLDLVFDELIGEEQIPAPDPPRWQEQLRTSRGRSAASACGTPTSCGSRSGASRWARTRCASRSACWRSCARAGCHPAWPCRATCCSSPR